MTEPRLRAVCALAAILVLSTVLGCSPSSASPSASPSGEVAEGAGADAGVDGRAEIDTGIPSDRCTCEATSADERECTCEASCRSEADRCAIQCSGGDCETAAPGLAACGQIECTDPQGFEFATFRCTLSGCAPEEPERPAGPCPPGAAAVGLEPDELQVLAPRRSQSSGVLRVETEGLYKIFNLRLAESGPRQRNESAYFRIPNSSGPGFPEESNCGSDFVLVDDDNDGPVDEPRSIGTFWLDAGENRIEMFHYCLRYADGECRELHDDESDSKTCDSGNANSVHFQAATACVVPLF